MTDSDPGNNKAGRGLVYCSVGSALLAVILWGVFSEEAFPLLDSTAVPLGATWVCPLGLLVAVASLLGAVTGLAALGQYRAKKSSAARGKAWTAVIIGFIQLAALVALMIYFNIRGLMR